VNPIDGNLSRRTLTGQRGKVASLLVRPLSHSHQQQRARRCYAGVKDADHFEVAARRAHMRGIQDDLSDGRLNMTYRKFVIAYVCRSIAKSIRRNETPKRFATDAFE
jgi:hypothetical protein